MNREGWIRDLLCCLDAKDSEGWLAFLAPDARFRFGNASIVEGKSAIGEAVTAFFASISGMRHNLVEVWDHSNTVIFRGEVTYSRLDGSTLTIPFLNVLKLEGSLIHDYLVYVDASELHSLPTR
jgi:hypothetical protein